MQRRALQVVVAIGGLVPVTAGALGALSPRLLALGGRPETLTHAAYLSGLLLGIGLAYWSLIPAIERQGRAFGLLSAIVVMGGAARLLLAARLDIWTPSVMLPLMMELVATPLLWLWQSRIAKASLLPPE